MLLCHAILLVVVPRRTARLRAAQTSLESLLRQVPGGPHAFFEPTRRRQGAPRAIRQTPSEVRLQTVTSYPQVNKSGAVAERAAAVLKEGGSVWFSDETTLRELPPLHAAWAPVGEQAEVVSSGRNVAANRAYPSVDDLADRATAWFADCSPDDFLRISGLSSSTFAWLLT
jgi:hypothetical protein